MARQHNFLHDNPNPINPYAMVAANALYNAADGPLLSEMGNQALHTIRNYWRALPAFIQNRFSFAGVGRYMRYRSTQDVVNDVYRQTNRALAGYRQYAYYSKGKDFAREKAAKAEAKLAGMNNQRMFVDRRIQLRYKRGYVGPKTARWLRAYNKKTKRRRRYGKNRK